MYFLHTCLARLCPLITFPEPKQSCGVSCNHDPAAMPLSSSSLTLAPQQRHPLPRGPRLTPIGGKQMKLEHRWNRRRSVHLNAVIFYRPLGLLRAKVLDVSLAGAFVETGRSMLPPQTLVEITFALEMDGKPHIHQTEALIVHQQPHGCGLLFKVVCFVVFWVVCVFLFVVCFVCLFFFFFFVFFFL